MTASDAFKIDPRLEADSFHISTVDGCQVRLMNDARYPWILLIPEAPNASELFDLPPSQADKVMALATRLGEQMKNKFSADKVNIAALGNVVKQLHIHIIARYENDQAWPNPVWGIGTASPLTDEDKHKRIHGIQMSIGQITSSSGSL